MDQYVSSISSSDMKEIELNLLQMIHNVCEDNNLYYFLAYGSCLGAVRHGGFIPWDDDIDIVMPYPDYRKLINIWKAFNGRYKIVSFEQDHTYKYPFAKLIDSSTSLVESELYDSQIGVYIDIFPLCGLPNNRIKRNLFFQRANLIEYFAIVARIRRLSGQTLVKKAIQCLMWPFSKLIGINTLNKLSMNNMSKCPFEKSDYVSVLPPNYDYREVFKKTIFDDRILTRFEGKEFYIPQNYDVYLTQMYGDYMKLPPENERVTHHTYKVVFEEESDIN